MDGRDEPRGRSEPGLGLAENSHTHREEQTPHAQGKPSEAGGAEGADGAPYDIKVPLKVRTTKEDAAVRRDGRAPSGRLGEAQPSYPPPQGYWMAWQPPPYGFDNSDILVRQGSVTGQAPPSPVPMGMGYKGPYMVFPMAVPDSPRGPTPLMGSPVSTPTAMMFPQTPFAQHTAYTPFGAAPGAFIGAHPCAPMEPMSPSRGHGPAVGYFHPLFNGFSPLVVGPGPHGPMGMPSPSKGSRTSAGGDKFRAYHPSPLKPPGLPTRRSTSYSSGGAPMLPPAAMSASGSMTGPTGSGGSFTRHFYAPHPHYPAMRLSAGTAQHCDPSSARSNQQQLATLEERGSLDTEESPPAAASLPPPHSRSAPPVREKEVQEVRPAPRASAPTASKPVPQQVEQVAPVVAITPVASPPPPAMADMVADAVAACSVSDVVAPDGSDQVSRLAEAVNAVAEAVKARMSMNGRVSLNGAVAARASLNGAAVAARMSLQGNEDVVSAAVAAATALHAVRQQQEAASAVAAAVGPQADEADVMAAAAAAMAHDVPSGGASGMSMFPGFMGHMGGMQAAAAAAAAAMYPDLSGLAAQAYWPAMPQLQGLAYGLPNAAAMGMPAFHMAQPTQMGLMHAAMMQQLSAAPMAAAHPSLAAAMGASMHGLHPGLHHPYLDPSAPAMDPYLAAAEQLAHLQALQGGAHNAMQHGHPYGLRPPGASSLAAQMASPSGPFGAGAGAMHRTPMAAAVPPGSHRHHRRNAGDVRVGPDGQARLNARQRRTLRRAKERAIRGLLEAGQMLVSRAGGDADDAEGSNTLVDSEQYGSDSEDDEGMIESPEVAHSQGRTTAEPSPIRSGDSETDNNKNEAGARLSADALAVAAKAAGAAAPRISSGASSVCEVTHSAGHSSTSSAAHGSSTASPAAHVLRCADVSSPVPVDSDLRPVRDLHATLLRNLSNLKEKMGPVQHKLDAAGLGSGAAASVASAAAAASNGGPGATASALGVDADLTALIQQLHQKREEGVIDEKLMRDLQIIQNLIGALKAPVPQGPAPRHKGPAGPMPMAPAGGVYLTNKAPAKGFALVH